jgi:hypothetical protein
MSTRQMDVDFSQKLPELRDTAKKYGRWNGNRLPDFQINTSAIGRAFPDFSQGDSSDDSMPIEVGRGAKTRQRTSSQQTRPQYSNNIDSPVVTIGDFQILSTPPMRSQPKPSQQQDAPRSSTRKAKVSAHQSARRKIYLHQINLRLLRGFKTTCPVLLVLAAENNDEHWQNFMLRLQMTLKDPSLGMSVQQQSHLLPNPLGLQTFSQRSLR